MVNIFTPIRVKEIEFKNRIAMAPMVRNGYPSDNGVMGEELLQEYLSYTDKNIGLIILQALFVMPSFQQYPWACAEEHMAPLRKITEACHKNGSKVFAQILLNGAEVQHRGGINGLTTEELSYIRDRFIRSAALCKEAGFDGVELHGAHELFLNQVSSELTNRRKDKYGGSFDGRLTLAKEIIEGIKAFAGSDFIVSYRMGATFDLDADVQTAQTLEKAGIDMIHVSYGISNVRYMNIPPEYRACNVVAYAGCFIKKKVGVPVIAVSDIRTLQRGNNLVEHGDCDFVAYGRPFLADPSFVIHSENDMDYEGCFGCRFCQWNRGHTGCPARKKLNL